MHFVAVYWYWAASILLGFLPLELFAARSRRKGFEGGTFSEWVWWTFGVKPRRRPCGCCDDGPVRFALARRLVLGAFLTGLWAHFVFGASPWVFVPFAPGVGFVIVYALLRERRWA